MLVKEALPEAIRAHPGIRGVEIANMQNKINLLADDVILMLTDDEQSLIHITELLQSISAVSYYNISTTKSLVLDIYLNSKIKQKLRLRFPCVWKDTSIPYTRPKFAL